MSLRRVWLCVSCFDDTFELSRCRKRQVDYEVGSRSRAEKGANCCGIGVGLIKSWVSAVRGRKEEGKKGC